MPNVLFLTAYPIEDASCRVRVHQFSPYLETAGYRCTVSSFCTPELFAALRSPGRLGGKLLGAMQCGGRRLSQLLDLADFEILFIHREAFPFFAPAVENWILRRHQKVIFSFDDAIYAGHSDISALNHPTLYRWKHGRGYDDVIRRSAHVIVGNRILADYAGSFNRNVSIVPTVVDCRRYLFRTPVSFPPITIGWMGSRTTAPYLSIVEPALRRLAESKPGKVQFRFLGCPDYRPQLPKSCSLPFDLHRELDDLHSLDIGLMPLPDTEWTRGKCAYKAIQYMASGVPVIASPVGITTDLIQHGINGLLADSGEAWFQELSRLVHDVELRRRLALRGRRTVEQFYSLEKWGPRFVEIFDKLSGTPSIAQPEVRAA
jgi:glycosyltransferase involved in cell wall biosynthesis